MPEVYTAKLRSVSPLSCSRFHNLPKPEKESHDAYEKRTWREKAYYDGPGPKACAVINPMMLKFTIAAAPRFTGEKIPGKPVS